MNQSARELYNQGKAFFKASKRLFEPKQISGGVETFPVPGIVCQAFSAEIFLKCFLFINDIEIPQKGHSLSKLFLLLHSEDKQEFSKSFNLTNEQIVSKISKYDKTFVQWRYAYENSHLEFEGEFLAKFCSNAIEILKLRYSSQISEPTRKTLITLGDCPLI